MPRYDYFCEHNGRTIEVTYSMTMQVDSWGELCDFAKLNPEGTPACVDKSTSRQRSMVSQSLKSKHLVLL